MLRLKFFVPHPIDKLDDLMKLSFSIIDTIANAKLSRHVWFFSFHCLENDWIEKKVF
jgi:hypothetical protein